MEDHKKAGIDIKAVLQRVTEASVTVEGTAIAQITKGFLILLGVENGDGPEEAQFLAGKTAGLRVFEDDKGKLNLSLLDIEGSALVVSNFTLCADCKRGKRPSFTQAAPPAEAEKLYEFYCQCLKQSGIQHVKTGKFGADMKVALVNDGPVTILLDTKEK